MNLYDKLPAEDKQLIKDYLEKYTKIDTLPNLELTLREWTKNKKTLYRALSNQFRIKIPIADSVDKKTIAHQLNEKYEMPCSYYYMSDISEDIKQMSGKRHHFVTKLLKYFNELSQQHHSYFYELSDISNNLTRILSWDTILEGYVRYFSSSMLTYKGKTLKCNTGVKPMRILRKILELIEFPDMSSFEDFCNDVSIVLTDKKNTTTNLVFSIHPIDFMTMSHNTCNWSSCMNWDGGCYSNGVLEMMNSNVVVVAYVESSTQDFIINGRNIPNKSWRCLYYVHKDIVCSGKPYPYWDESLVRGGLKALANLVKKNLHWTYQYKNQRYYDMYNFGTNESARDYIPNKYSNNEHNIVLYNYAAMYNDFANDHEEEYYCYRNWVPKTLKLCVSGPATCVICGEPITTTREIRKEIYWNDSDFSSRGCSKICVSCRDKYYNDYTDTYYLSTSSLYSVRVFNLFRRYNWEKNRYTFAHSYSTIYIAEDDFNDFITPDMSVLPLSFFNYLQEEIDAPISNNFIMSKRRCGNSLYHAVVDCGLCKTIEEAQKYFIPITTQIIGSFD